LWKKLLESEEEVMHVVEDDATVLATVEEINKFIQAVTSDWDIIYLGFHKMSVYPAKDVKVSDGVYRINSPTFQTHSYLIHRRGAKKLLQKALPIVHHVDSYMSFMAIQGGVIAYRPSAQLFSQQMALVSQVSHGLLSKDELLVTITRQPCYVIILCILISLLFLVSYLIKGISRLKFKNLDSR
jgi:GR25 family glycosyltransferase involved in LPS biosynthesis